MKSISYDEFRRHPAKYMDQACDSSAPVRIRRKDGRHVVVISEHEYAGMKETIHLLGSPANAARLLDSLASANRGELSEHELLDP